MAYNINEPTELNAWNSKAHPIFIFGSIEFLEIDSKNMFTFLLYMADYIRSRKVKKGLINNILELKCFSKAAWNFISSIYKAGWDTIDINKDNNSFKNGIANKFTPKVPNIKPSSNSNTSKDKAVEIIRLSSMVHTGVKVHRMDSEMSGLVERPWLQLMCCAVYLLRDRNFR